MLLEIYSGREWVVGRGRGADWGGGGDGKRGVGFERGVFVGVV